jgi:hypothetical protein
MKKDLIKNITFANKLTEDGNENIQTFTLRQFRFQKDYYRELCVCR